MLSQYVKFLPSGGFFLSAVSLRINLATVLQPARPSFLFSLIDHVLIEYFVLSYQYVLPADRLRACSLCSWLFMFFPILSSSTKLLSLSVEWKWNVLSVDYSVSEVIV